GITREEAVILVLTVARVASIATLLQAEDVSMTIIPTSRMLCEITTDRGYIANLLRAYFGSRLLKTREGSAERFMILQLGDRHVCTNGPGLFAWLDFVEPWQRFDVYQDFGFSDVLLHLGEEIDAASKIASVTAG